MNFAQFPSRAQLQEGDQLVGYRTPAPNGEGRWTVAALRAALWQSSASLVVPTTASATANGAALLAAYAAAKLLTPNGAALSKSNRAVVIVPPGVYDLATAELVLDTQYVDLVGLTTDRAAQRIESNVGVANSAVLRQTADDVRIENITAFNSNTTYVMAWDETDPAAYRPDISTPNAILKNCAFICDFDWDRYQHGCFGTAYGGASTPFVWAGSYIDCEATYSFAGGSAVCSGHFERCRTVFPTAEAGFDDGEGFDSWNGMASGIFIDCYVAYRGFAGGNGGEASGVFLNCNVATLSGAFDSGSGFGFGVNIASGTFVDCTSRSLSFGTALSSGVFRNCYANNGFGLGAGSIASGEYLNCRADGFGFAGDQPGSSSIASGSFYHCVARGGYSFGGTASGYFKGCAAGQNSFGTHSASGEFIDCIAMVNPAAGGEDTGSFGGYDGTSTCSGVLLNCQLKGFNRSGTFTGRMENCRWEISMTDALTVGAGVRIYNSTIIAGNAPNKSITAASAVTASIAHCRTNRGIHSNVTNSVGTPYNVDDTDIS